MERFAGRPNPPDRVGQVMAAYCFRLRKVTGEKTTPVFRRGNPYVSSTNWADKGKVRLTLPVLTCLSRVRLLLYYPPLFSGHGGYGCVRTEATRSSSTAFSPPVPWCL